MLRDAALIARKDLLLELRRREVVLSMTLLVLGTVVIGGLLLGQAEPRVAAAVLWIAILFTASVGLARAFASEFEDDAFDAVSLAVRDRSSIFVGKAVAQGVFLLVMEAIAVPAFLLASTSADAAAVLQVALVALVADIGLAAVGVLIAALASGARARELVMPVLLVPVATPLVLAGVTGTAAALEGGSIARPLAFLVLYGTLFGALAWGTFEQVIGD